MKIKEIKINNFKRFSNVIISNIPEKAKLVLIVGANGSGKSSLFDAFHNWYRNRVGFGNRKDDSYFRKDSSLEFDYYRNVEIKFYDYNEESFIKKGMYFRSAYRNDPDFNVNSFSTIGKPYDSLGLQRLIDNDQTVSTNYQRLVSSTLTELYSNDNDDKKVKELREELIGQIRTSMQNVFSDLIVNNIGDPFSGGSFHFEKGKSKNFHYKNLSGGEKSAFDLLLDLILKINHYDNTVFCIDEPESHMHTSLQGKLIKEIFDIIPDKSQLWLATHSFGIMNVAKEIAITNPELVAIIDFDGNNFDSGTIIKPSKIDKVLWEKFLSLSIGEFSQQMVSETIVLCEGSLDGRKRKNFDAEIYNTIFSQKYPNISFVSGGSCTELLSDDNKSYNLLKEVLKSSKIIRLVDRDDLSSQEVDAYKKRNIIVLTRRHLESYLFDDEVLLKLTKIASDENNFEVKKNELLSAKQTLIKNSINRNNPADDIKSASGEIYNSTKQILSLQQCGNNAEAFMRDTLAPLITDNSNIFKALENEIINTPQIQNS